ncbi:MAG TPA: hypothetical protein VF865_09920 [Acidobacteriaceae bacterium]
MKQFDLRAWMAKGRGRFWLALLVGLVFLLPHLVRMTAIASYRDYTPFAAQSLSPMEWDETFLYGPEANYMLERHSLASDTDTWEHRNQPFPYSVLPIAVEAVIAEFAHGLGNAQMICYFVFPAIAAWLLMGIFVRAGANVPLAAALALTVLAVGFSPRTVLAGDAALLRHGLRGGVVDTMQGARTPNPNMTFPLYLGAIVCLSAAIRGRTLGDRRVAPMVAAGALGGLLFYSYTYYAVGWSAAVLLLVLLSLVGTVGIPGEVVWTLAATAVTSLPFLFWKHASAVSGAYENRMSRLGKTLGHLPTGPGLKLTLVWGLVGVAGVGAWRWLRPRVISAGLAEQTRKQYVTVLVTVLGCCLAGGIAGLNMQVVTGFNVQAEHHFPHMLLQPVAVVLVCLLAAASSRWLKMGTLCGGILFVALFLACCGAQVEAARNSAEIHRMSAADRVLFGWLQAYSAAGSVVATTDLRLATVLPLYTHNGTLVANGTRTSASDRELVERYLLASALTRTPAVKVEAALSQEIGSANLPLPLVTVSYFLFETSPEFIDSSRRRMKQSVLPGVMEWYRHMDVADELKLLRVDYVWTNSGLPPETQGLQWERVLNTRDGSLWKLERQGTLPAD